MTAVPLLLERLDLHGSVVTTDALNTQKSGASAIQGGGGDYVLALKPNHSHLSEDVRDTFVWCQNQSHNPNALYEGLWQSSEWNHGRHEVRRGFCLSALPHEWPQAVRA